VPVTRLEPIDELIDRLLAVSHHVERVHPVRVRRERRPARVAAGA
jgi:hypothetical protein